MTARDLQRGDGQWSRGKSFDTFCPVGRVIRKGLPAPDARITTTVNGELRQEGRLSEMTFGLARLVGPTEQGRLQGANTSVMGISGLVGPWLFTLVFATFIGSQNGLHQPGAPFFLAGSFLVMAFFIAWRVARSVGV